jgi:hypothetical protein
LAAVALAALQLSCAGGGLTPDPHPMPAARAALKPEYRVFFDELQSYGDWILIEPYGFVFRPRLTFADTWSPYWDGFWSPSDQYGWVWVSAEPFGWATYHYGRWLQDDYQGWVWVPGLDWAPAWVAWTANDQYVGWAALAPNGGPSKPATASSFMYVPRSAMGSTNLQSRILSPSASRSVGEQRPVQNLDAVDQVLVNKGPRIDWVEQVAGPLQRTTVQEITRIPDTHTGHAPSDGSTHAAPAPASTERKDTLQRQAEENARQTRAMMKQKQPSPRVIPMIKPMPKKDEGSQKSDTGPKESAPAPADTTR